MRIMHIEKEDNKWILNVFSKESKVFKCPYSACKEFFLWANSDIEDVSALLNQAIQEPIKSFEYFKSLECQPIIFLDLLQCDYARGWTWFLRVGDKQSVGWTPNSQGISHQDTPIDAFNDFITWVNEIPPEKIKELIESECN